MIRWNIKTHQILQVLADKGRIGPTEVVREIASKWGSVLDYKTVRDTLNQLSELGAVKKEDGARPKYSLTENVLCLPGGLLVIKSETAAWVSPLLCRYQDRCPIPEEDRPRIYEKHGEDCPLFREYRRSVEEFIKK